LPQTLFFFTPECQLIQPDFPSEFIESNDVFGDPAGDAFPGADRGRHFYVFADDHSDVSYCDDLIYGDSNAFGDYVYGLLDDHGDFFCDDDLICGVPNVYCHGDDVHVSYVRAILYKGDSNNVWNNYGNRGGRCYTRRSKNLSVRLKRLARIRFLPDRSEFQVVPTRYW